MDEFQEFFVEDDKIAQEAAQLLDRLVRQGRAFGIHVLLGSQTLGGAYSLARSTIDQMAVRIALAMQRSGRPPDSQQGQLGARLLSRPGEAIYNAASGLLEGNHLFQVVWLSDEQRDDGLAKVRTLAEERHVKTHQIVFEGTAPSDIVNNPLLALPARAARRTRHQCPSASLARRSGRHQVTPPPRSSAGKVAPI